MDNIFEYATRNKLRFTTPRGELSVEQLWDVPLRSTDGFNLDEVAKAASKALKAATEESFVAAPRKANVVLEVRLEVIKAVIGAKLADEDAAKRRAENRQKRDQLLAVLSRKEGEQLDALSIKDIKKKLEALED